MSIMKRIGLSLGIGIVGINLLVCCSLAKTEQVSSDTGEWTKTNVFIIDSYHSQIPKDIVDKDIKLRLDKQGFKLICSISGDYKDINWRVLRDYNILILARVPRWGQPEAAQKFIRKKNILYRYLKQGGGILIFVDYNAYSPAQGNHHTLNEFLKPLGLELLPEEVKSKIEFSYEVPQSGDVKYGKTDEILSSHPIAKNIDHIYFPVGSGNPYWNEGEIRTTTFKATADWQIIITAGKNSHSVTYPSTGTVRPPILAVREYGEGRIAVFSSIAPVWFTHPYHPVFKGFVLEKGGYKLIDNLLIWLAEPSFKRFGQVEVQQEELPANYTDPWSRWLSLDEQKVVGKPYRGIIGAHTKYSGGKYSVKDFCNKAKQLGYSFIIFTESLDKLDKTKWAELSNDCKKESNKDFVAIPGIEFIKDSHMKGNTGIAFNLLHWPSLKKEDLGWSIGHALMFQLDWPNLITTTPHKGCWPPHWDQFTTGIEIFSYKGKDLIDQAVDEYKELQANTYNMEPIVSHRIWSPEEMDTLQDTYHTYVIAKSVSDIPDSLKVQGMGKGLVSPRIKTTFVSNGPLIKAFYNEGPSRMVTLWTDFYCWTPGEKMNLHIDVSSEYPIDKIELYSRYNSEKPYRIFRPKKHQFKLVLEEIMAQSGPYFIIVEDSKGRKAYSSAICYPHELHYTAYHGYALREDCDHLLFVAGRAAWCQDFGSGYADIANFWISYPYPGKEKLVMKHIGRFFSPAGTISDIEYPYAKNKEETAGWNKVETLNLKQRIYCFNNEFMPAVGVVEVTAKILKPIELPDQAIPVFSFSPRIGNYDNFVYRISKLGQEKSEPISNKHIVLTEGSYSYIYSKKWGSLGILGFDNQKYDLTLDGQTMTLSLPVQTRLLPAGTLYKAKFIYMSHNIDDMSFFRNFWDKYGFDGNPTYGIRLTHGKVIETTYPCVVRADNYYIKGNITGIGSLPVKRAEVPCLPLRVDNINSNWDAAIIDLNTAKLTRIGTYENSAYVLLATTEPTKDIFVGNLLICPDQPDIRLTVLDYQNGLIKFVVHNPSEKKVTIRIESPVELQILDEKILPRSTPEKERQKYAQEKKNLITIPKFGCKLTLKPGTSKLLFGYRNFAVQTSGEILGSISWDSKKKVLSYVSSNDFSEGKIAVEEIIYPKKRRIKQLLLDNIPAKFNKTADGISFRTCGVTQVKVLFK